MRRLPHQGARHSTVDHGDASDGVFLLLRGCLGRASTSSSTCGCFLRVERSFLWMISLLFSFSSLWTTSQANGSFPANGGTSTYLGLTHLHTQETGDRTALGMGQASRPAWADQPRPISARFWRPFAHVGPLVIMYFAPSICTILTMSSSCPRCRAFSNEVRTFTL
jgi:hypothetical protein